MQIGEKLLLAGQDRGRERHNRRYRGMRPIHRSVARPSLAPEVR